MCVYLLSPALRMAFLLLLLISATWLLGLMAVNSDVLTFHYLFAGFSCLQVIPEKNAPPRCTLEPPLNAIAFASQGIFIFFFHIVFNKDVRKHLKNVFTGKKNFAEETTATRASLLTVRNRVHYFFSMCVFALFR